MHTEVQTSYFFLVTELSHEAFHLTQGQVVPSRATDSGYIGSM